jgi:hypothetical protein
MPEKALIKNLQELQIELEHLNFENESHKQKLNQSIAEVQKKLRDKSFMSGDEYLIHEMKESLAQFEQSHPGLTDILGRMSDLLAKMGI